VLGWSGVLQLKWQLCGSVDGQCDTFSILPIFLVGAQAAAAAAAAALVRISIIQTICSRCTLKVPPSLECRLIPLRWRLISTFCLMPFAALVPTLQGTSTPPESQARPGSNPVLLKPILLTITFNVVDLLGRRIPACDWRPGHDTLLALTVAARAAAVRAAAVRAHLTVCWSCRLRGALDGIFCADLYALSQQTVGLLR
jgi:hypothetical protein